MTETDQPTRYVQISDDYREGYDVDPEVNENGDEEPYTGGVIAGTGKITSIIEGELAARVLTRTCRVSGVVTIIEDHWDSGYCVTCSFEEVDFEVQVDGVKVFRTHHAASGDARIGPEFLTSYAEFNSWLQEA